MKTLEENSLFIVNVDFSQSPLDDEVLATLYLPIIKKNAFALYRVLLDNRQVFDKVTCIHEELLTDLDISLPDFLKAREKLEGIGLIRTFRKENANSACYIYKLYPVASPKKFFSDIILKNMLKITVGEKRFVSLSTRFQCGDRFDEKSYVEVTANFKDNYTLPNDIDFDREENLLDKEYRSCENFSKEKLLNLIAPIKLKENEIGEVIETSLLYNINEEECANLVINNVDSDSQLYLDSFKNDCRNYHKYETEKRVDVQSVEFGKEMTSKNLALFELYPPKKFLQVYYNAEPNVYMLKEVEKLKSTFHFSNGVINLILNYALKNSQGKFSSNFIELVAFTLSSKNVQTSYQAYVELMNMKSLKKKAKEEPKEKQIEDDDSGIDDLIGDLIV